jgi:hypothetical protein
MSSNSGITFTYLAFSIALSGLMAWALSRAFFRGIEGAAGAKRTGLVVIWMMILAIAISTRI